MKAARLDCPTANSAPAGAVPARVGPTPVWRLLWRLGGQAGFRTLLGNLLRWEHFYQLRMALSQLPAPIPPLRAGYRLERATDDDLRGLEDRIGELPPPDRRELVSRLLFYRQGMRRCYVVRNREDRIVYLQWLILPEDNPLIAARFSSVFLPLGDNQVMVENAFTFPDHRGVGLMPVVTLHLLDMARQAGRRSAIGYIRKDRLTSINEFIRLGFRITSMAGEIKFLGKAWRFWGAPNRG